MDTGIHLQPLLQPHLAARAAGARIRHLLDLELLVKGIMVLSGPVCHQLTVVVVAAGRALLVALGRLLLAAAVGMVLQIQSLGHQLHTQAAAAAVQVTALVQVVEELEAAALALLMRRRLPQELQTQVAAAAAQARR